MTKPKIENSIYPAGTPKETKLETARRELAETRLTLLNTQQAREIALKQVAEARETIDYLKVELFNVHLEYAKLRGWKDRVEQDDLEKAEVLDVTEPGQSPGLPPIVKPIFKQDIKLWRYHQGMNGIPDPSTPVWDGERAYGTTRDTPKPKHWVNK